MHTSASDGKSGVNELLHFVARRRPYLDVIAITDHDTLDASLRALELAHLFPFEIIPGVEVTSRDGHVLALWVATAIPRDMSLEDTTAAIHEAGGIAILAHPFHIFLAEYRQQALRYLHDPEVLLMAGVDGVETHNAGICGTGCNWFAARYARRVGLAVTGGSDAHTLGAIGTGLTRFSGYRAQDLRHAILNKATSTEGQPWSITDYISYFRHEKQRKAMISSVNMNSSPIISS